MINNSKFVNLKLPMWNHCMAAGYFYVGTIQVPTNHTISVKSTSGASSRRFTQIHNSYFTALQNKSWLENQYFGCNFSNIQQGEQLPWGDDCTERLQHLPCSKPLLRVQHQQLSDQAHCVLRHTTVPERRWRTTGKGPFYLQNVTISHKSTKPLLKDYTVISSGPNWIRKMW